MPYQTLNKDSIDWGKYAETYDMLLGHNKFYQDLQAEVITIIKDWELMAGDQLIDLAAGTGNYSVAVAKLFPDTEVIHLDLNKGMNDVAQHKKEELDIVNLDIRTDNVMEIDFSPNTFAGILCIHALYTFPNPGRMLKKMYDWMTPGGRGVFVDPGKPVNVLGWKIAIANEIRKQDGWGKMIELMKKGRKISRINKDISKKQKSGEYWTHTHQVFLDTVSAAGFEILESRKTFRQLSDLVVVAKPG